MAEIIAYEDSPLAQYLQEIDASETIVTDDKPDTADSVADKSFLAIISTEFVLTYRRVSQLATRTLGLQDNYISASTIAKEMHSHIVSTLTDSGLIAERYTPRPCRIASQPLGANISALPTRSTISIAGLFAMAITPSAVACMTLAFRPGGLGDLNWSLGITLFILLVGPLLPLAEISGLLIQERSQRQVPIDRCNDALEKFNCMLVKCRAMDSAVQRALRLVMDVDVVTRGFRLPQYHGSQAISSMPGRGTAWMAEHVRQTIDSALSLSIDTLADIIEHPKQQTSQYSEAEGFLDSNTRAHMAELRAQLSDDGELESMTLEALRNKFALHFAMRRLWLESVVRTLEPSSDVDIRPEQLLSICGLVVSDITRVSETASLSASRVKEATEARYTAGKWASLAATKSVSTDSHHPLVRALSNMSEALDTVRAKILVCRECVSMVDDHVVDFEDKEAVPSPEEIARVFASLKPDIDALNHLYQASVTSLAFYDSGSGPISGDNDDSTRVPAELTDYELGSMAIPEGATVFGYTPVGGDDLDAPELIFEADIERETGQERLKVVYTEKRSQMFVSPSLLLTDLCFFYSKSICVVAVQHRSERANSPFEAKASRRGKHATALTISDK
ncbi:hypothetical protein FBU31_001477 [Coemansia sp. 'formosensis']|nr:hypothetical protein FBU31_001477 [Coemansia sp. 'formosensis']